MLLYRDTPHCSVPSLSHAAAGKHQWERRKRNTPQCLPTDTVVLHPPARLTISFTHLTHVMKSRDNNQRLQSSTHLEQVLLTTIKSANYSVTAHTPETTRNEYNVRVSLHAVLSENVKYFPTTDVHQRQVMRLKEQSNILGNIDMLVCHLCMARWSSAPLSQSHRVQRSTRYDRFNQA